MNGSLIAVKGKFVNKTVKSPSGKLTIKVFVPALDKKGNPIK